jgi:hypothetical protein
MKKVANKLNPILTREMKTRPWFLSAELWQDVKSVLEEFRLLLTDSYLSEMQLRDIFVFMDIGFETIASMYTNEETFNAHQHIYDIMDHYLELGISMELYECCQNIYKVRESFLVKIPKEIKKNDKNKTG